MPQSGSAIGLGLLVSAILIRGLSQDQELSIKSVPGKGTHASFVIKNWEQVRTGIKIRRYKCQDQIMLGCLTSTESVFTPGMFPSDHLRKIRKQKTTLPCNPQNSFTFIPQLRHSSVHDQSMRQKQFFEFLEEENLNIKNRVNSKYISDPELDAKNQQCQCNKILIVDDDDFNRMALRTMLRRYSLSADEAKNGQLALDKVKLRHNQCSACQTYQLIIMDIDMPILNGYQSAQLITGYLRQSAVRAMPCICIHSAYFGKEDYEKSKEIGISMFLEKPINPNELQNLIKTVFGGVICPLRARA